MTHNLNKVVRQTPGASNEHLTLRMDENLIAQAKAYAASQGRSVSDLVGNYFARLEGVNAPAKVRK